MSAAASGQRGVVLFAHGARDPRWAEPFERLRAMVASRLGDGHVLLAYLELMKPGLDEAADALVAAGCEQLAIVPIFLGQGSHLRRDLPQLVEGLRARLPSVPVTVAGAAGEEESVLAAIATYCANVVGDAPSA